MIVLYETAMGFALFKLTDSAKLTDPDLYKEFETPERANGLCVYLFFTTKDIHQVYMPDTLSTYAGLNLNLYTALRRQQLPLRKSP
jgi:hypothetical protein